MTNKIISLTEYFGKNVIESKELNGLKVVISSNHRCYGGISVGETGTLFVKYGDAKIVLDKNSKNIGAISITMLFDDFNPRRYSFYGFDINGTFHRVGTGYKANVYMDEISVFAKANNKEVKLIKKGE